VDNASSDGTPDVVEREFPAVKLIRNRENLGFARGNNIGVKESTGKYVSLINSDVVASQGCLDQLLEYMEHHPDIGVLGPKMIMPDGSVGASCMSFPTVANWFWRALALDTIFKRSRRFGAYLMTYFPYDRLADVEVLTGWFWVIRREAMEQVGLLDERFFMYGEDIDWCKRFHSAGWRVVFFPRATAIHYCAASSAKAPIRFYIEEARANLQYCRRHHGTLAVAGFWFGSVLHEVIRIVGHGVSCILNSSVRDEGSFKVRRGWRCLLWLVGLGLSEGGGNDRRL
jgi:GT2 family glycosyltransferase